MDLRKYESSKFDGNLNVQSDLVEYLNLEIDASYNILSHDLLIVTFINSLYDEKIIKLLVGAEKLCKKGRILDKAHELVFTYFSSNLKNIDIQSLKSMK